MGRVGIGHSDVDVHHPEPTASVHHFTYPAVFDGIIFTLVTDEVETWHTYLTAQGVTFDKAPAYNPKYNIDHCFVRDPNGYLIEIQRFHDPAWPTPASHP
ncbi:MAG: VOC family protein [Myxococcota bacterium]